MDSYREELVKIIQDVGKDLTERAEEFVSKYADYICGVDIHVSIPSDGSGQPEIRYSYDTICKNFIKRHNPEIFPKESEQRDESFVKDIAIVTFDHFSNQTKLRCPYCNKETVYDGIVVFQTPTKECPHCNKTFKI